MHYQEKYIKYKTKYLEEKYKINILNKLENTFLHSGGGNGEEKKISIKMNNLVSLIKYITAKYKDMDKLPNTNKKYIVILYGPPSSGKTLAKKIGCYLIKEHFHESLSEQNILKTFVDSNIDDLTYDRYICNKTKVNCKRLQDKLLEELKKYKIEANIPNDTLIDTTNITNPKINEYIKLSENIYFSNRVDTLSELMISLGSFLNRNIFLETASGNMGYIEQILKLLSWYNYIPIIIYPYVLKYNGLTDTDLLYERATDRGNKEGRFVRKEKIEELTNKSIEKYNDLIINKDHFLYTYKNLIIYRYNAKISQEEYNKINSFDFSRINDIKLDTYIKFDGLNKIEKKI